MIAHYNSFMNEKTIYPLQKRLSNFIKDFKKMGYPNPFDVTEVIIDDKAGIKLKVQTDKIQIRGIRSFEKTSDSASEILNDIIQLSNIHDVVLGLSPVSYGDAGLSADQLIMWYSKHGFIKHQGEFIRAPHI